VKLNCSKLLFTVSTTSINAMLKKLRHSGKDVNTAMCRYTTEKGGTSEREDVEGKGRRSVSANIPCFQSKTEEPIK